MRRVTASSRCLDERGAPIGAARTDGDAEYGLFEEATRRHTAVPAADQALSSPSGWYELLRFGRNIGRGAAATDKDPLPANAAHWRRIVGADGAAVWADLNAEGSFKFSDADFLPVMGWNCIDDDTSPSDQRCDSVNLKNLVRDPDPANTARLETSELAKRLGDEAVMRKLRRTICKFPSEWDKTSIAARYAFVQELEPFKQSPEAWPRLEAHLKAVSFDGLPAGYLAADWRVHPQEFFGQMRKCGWLSADELSLIIPRFPYYDRVGTTHRAHTAGPAAIYQVARQTVRTRLGNFLVPLNRTMRRYGIQSKGRQGHFLSQTILETDRWRTVREYGQGAANAAIPMAQYYAAFFGRGIMQLTWLGNYRDYLNYRTTGALANNVGVYSDRRITQQSTHWTGAPGGGSAQVRWAPKFDPEVIASNAENACDSGGFYWASKAIGQGAHDLNTTCDRGITPDVVGRVSVLVNGGGNGYMERQAYAQYLFRYLFDEVISASPVDVVTPRGRISVNFEKPQ